MSPVLCLCLCLCLCDETVANFDCVYSFVCAFAVHLANNKPEANGSSEEFSKKKKTSRKIEVTHSERIFDSLNAILKCATFCLNIEDVSTWVICVLFFFFILTHSFFT